MKSLIYYTFNKHLYGYTRSKKENGLSSEILLSSRNEVNRRPNLKTVGKAKRLQVVPTTFQPSFLCCGDGIYFLLKLRFPLFF